MSILRALPVLLSLILLTANAGGAQEGSGPLAQARQMLGAQDWYGAAELLEGLTQDEPENAQAWYLLGYALHAAGDLETAVELHAKAAEFPAVAANASYNAACAHALLGDADQAFHWLQRAVDAGFSNLSQLASDADLASLRNDPRFQAFLPIGQEASFLEDLQVLLTLNGEAAGDRFGWIGRNAGDVDGDGVNDILLSAPFKNLGRGGEGRIYLYSGKTGKLLLQRDGQAGYLLGIGIESAGDVNGDGTPDLLAGASGAKGTGAAFLYSGTDGELLHELWGSAAGDNFGRKVAGAGDQDGDGHDDVIVGAPGFDGAGADAGRAFVFSGRTGEPLYVLDGEAAGDNFGSCVDGYSKGTERLLIVGAMGAGEKSCGRVYVYRVGDDGPSLAFRIEGRAGDVNLGRMFVSAIGDVNGDGAMDVYASDWESNANGRAGSGRVYIHSGRDGARLYDLAGKNPGDGFGIGTAEAGDVDGDGCDDFLIGAWQNDDGAQGGGQCTLYSGRSGHVLQTYTCATFGDTFGFDTTTLGDVNGDRVPDFLITAADSFVSGRQSGRVFVIAGPARPTEASAGADKK